jgi:hypothetical protein
MKNKHGGKRPNSGAKLKYGEETKTIAFRIPISKEKYFKELINKELKAIER